MEENLIVPPGWTRNKRSYRKLIDAAPSNWQVFVPSYSELKPYKGMFIVNQGLLNYLKKHSLSKVNLLGHSLGGALVLHFAASHPEKLKRLFLVDVKGVYRAESLLSDIYYIYRENRRGGFVAYISKMSRMLKNPMLNFRLGLLANAIHIGKEARGIKVRTYIFWGEEDLIAPLSHGKKLRQLILNSKLFVLKGMGHDWILNSPEHFWEKICNISPLLTRGSCD